MAAAAAEAAAAEAAAEQAGQQGGKAMARLWQRLESLDKKVMNWTEEGWLSDWHAIDDRELERSRRVSVVSGQRGEERGPGVLGQKRGGDGEASPGAPNSKGGKGG